MTNTLYLLAERRAERAAYFAKRALLREVARDLSLSTGTTVSVESIRQDFEEAAKLAANKAREESLRRAGFSSRGFRPDSYQP